MKTYVKLSCTIISASILNVCERCIHHWLGRPNGKGVGTPLLQNVYMMVCLLVYYIYGLQISSVQSKL